MMLCACADMLEIVWRVSYAIITLVLLFMLCWRIFGLKENALFRSRVKDGGLSGIFLPLAQQALSFLPDPRQLALLAAIVPIEVLATSFNIH